MSGHGVIVARSAIIRRMRARHWARAGAFALVLTGLACGDDGGAAGAGGGGGTSTGTGSGASTASCEGTYQILQKDAYREVAGRSSELWPPHTTTQLSYGCGPDAAPVTTFQANHGTEPGATDANGDIFLVETGTVAITGSEADLNALREAYDACLCDTAFLSLDALEDQAVQDLVQAIGSYITMNLTCTGSVDAAGLVMLLEMGDVDAVIAELDNCTWSGMASWDGAFDEALTAIIAQAMETLDDYHVCNNDALLQAKLVEGFVQTGEIVPCDGDDPICHGPAWFYTP